MEDDGRRERLAGERGAAGQGQVGGDSAYMIAK
jgi:hypothetical protein